MIEYEFYLDVTRQGPQQLLKGFKSGETQTRRLNIILTDGKRILDMADGTAAVSFCAVKPDDTLIRGACTVEENKISHIMTTQELAVPGRMRCEIRVQYSEGDSSMPVMYTPCFDIMIDGSLYDDDAPISQNEDSQFSVLVGRIDSMSQSMATKLSDLEDDSGHRTVTDAEKASWNFACQIKVYTLVWNENGNDDSANLVKINEIRSNRNCMALISVHGAVFPATVRITNGQVDICGVDGSDGFAGYEIFSYDSSTVQYSTFRDIDSELSLSSENPVQNKVVKAAIDTLNAKALDMALPNVTASDNGKVLTVVNGAWAVASIPNA